MAGDSNSKDLARHLTEAIERGETAFVKTLMEAVKKRGIPHVAKEIGTTRFVLYKYARGGVRLPRLDMLVKMATACGVLPPLWTEELFRYGALAAFYAAAITSGMLFERLMIWIGKPRSHGTSSSSTAILSAISR